jgi:hypothetical protein
MCATTVGVFFFWGGHAQRRPGRERTNQQRPMMMNNFAATGRRRPLRRRRIERTAAERTSLREKRAFQSKVSLILTAVTLGLLLLLSLCTTDRNLAAVTYNQDDGRPAEELQQQPQERQSAWRQRRRRLKKDEDNNDESASSATNTTTDYSHYSCNSLNEVTPIAGDDQCNFATTCNRNVGVWAPIVYCSPHGRIWLIFLSPCSYGSFYCFECSAVPRKITFLPLWKCLVARYVGEKPAIFFFLYLSFTDTAVFYCNTTPATDRTDLFFILPAWTTTPICRCFVIGVGQWRRRCVGYG